MLDGTIDDVSSTLQLHGEPVVKTMVAHRNSKEQDGFLSTRSRNAPTISQTPMKSVLGAMERYINQQVHQWFSKENFLPEFIREKIEPRRKQ